MKPYENEGFDDVYDDDEHWETLQPTLAVLVLPSNLDATQMALVRTAFAEGGPSPDAPHAAGTQAAELAGAPRPNTALASLNGFYAPLPMDAFHCAPQTHPNAAAPSLQPWLLDTSAQAIAAALAADVTGASSCPEHSRLCPAAPCTTLSAALELRGRISLKLNYVQQRWDVRVFSAALPPEAFERLCAADHVEVVHMAAMPHERMPSHWRHWLPAVARGHCFDAACEYEEPQHLFSYNVKRVPH